MRKLVGISLLLLSVFVLSASALEFESLTVDGNYWFGTTDGLFLGEPATFKHDSLNAAVALRFAPGFILGTDYTYGKLSSPSINGEAFNPDGYNFSCNQQLLGVSGGYPYLLSPGFNVTATAGLGYYVNTQKFWNSDTPEDKGSFIIKGTNPQVGLAAQYKITSQFSLRGNFITFLSNKGTVTVASAGVAARGSQSEDLILKLYRWQLEGKYLIKPGFEVLAGYRVLDLKIFPREEDDQSLPFDSNGLYLGARYSF